MSGMVAEKYILHPKLKDTAENDWQKKIIDAVNECGSNAKAAEKLGCNRRSLDRQVTKIKLLGAEAGMTTNDRDKQSIRELERKIEKLKREKEAAEMAAGEAERISRDFLASTFDIPKQKISKARAKNSYIRVAFGDTHGASICPQFWSAFLTDLEYLKPKQLIHGGDGVDCDGFLAEHQTTNYVAQTRYSYADDIVAANQMLDDIQRVAPKAEIDYIEGNHENRVERWAVTITKRKQADAELLLKHISPRTLMSIDKRGIKYWPYGETHDSPTTGGAIRKGLCWYVHPSSSAKHSAAKLVEQYEANVVYFHTHRRDYYAKTNVLGEERAAWGPGCACVKRKYYHHNNNWGHNNGYNLQFVQSNESFLSLNVPIINGVSLLSELGKELV